MTTESSARWRWPPGLSSSRATWIAWGILLLVVQVMTVRKIQHHPERPLANVTEEYASHRWWSRVDLYRPLDEPFFLYLPHAAILYTPFHAGPKLVRHLVVRAAYLMFFAAALFAFAGLGDPKRRGLRFLLMTFVCLPLTGDSARAAQANLPLAAFMLLASVAIARGRWTWGTVALLAGVAIKPLGGVWLLLAACMWPRTMGWRIAVGLVGLAAFPFAFGPPRYVGSQYADFFRKMVMETDPTRNFSDIRGFLEFGFGLPISNATALAIRAAGALATFGVALVARRRWDRTGAALAFYVLAACYLMLFNPKTEAPTYTLLGPAIGVLFAWSVLYLHSAALSVVLAGTAYGIAFTYEIWGHHQYVWQPSLTFVTLGIAVLTILVAPWSRRGCPWIPPQPEAPSQVS